MSKDESKKDQRQAGFVDVEDFTKLVRGESDSIVLQLSDLDLSKGNVALVQLTLVEIDRENKTVLTPNLLHIVKMNVTFAVLKPTEKTDTHVTLDMDDITLFQDSVVYHLCDKLKNHSIEPGTINDLIVTPLFDRNLAHPLFDDYSIVEFAVDAIENKLQAINCFLELKQGDLNKLGYPTEELIEIDLTNVTPQEGFNDQDVWQALLENTKKTLANRVIKEADISCSQP